jgi:hypothetical protein
MCFVVLVAVMLNMSMLYITPVLHHFNACSLSRVVRLLAAIMMWCLLLKRHKLSSFARSCMLATLSFLSGYYIGMII